ncbi:pyridoxamine 5'-phosphate oxidase [Flavobacterium sp. xlx-214]|uniref:pyridoxamine 5'-phosphate oxidase n=1 Tax=unclassified Flavobacterium TaxID=196869 RepID=UPI0013D11B09|nr:MULTISPECIES: pyridoxamine 5'-phosphate oxidase [unclassified Flavobacterium]MBA5793125.1 pyridoxamine 5'-phosphate oxidase [Flavobacterium sp. xlx-221]QMI82588.1 pyridoxamine 5'-phosphate oxidase [Flavobacterium sp. xlx-214]
MNDLGNYRKSYNKSELLESMIDENPMMQFQKWFYETEEFGGVDEVNAMTVSTIGLDGFPKSRIVLLKKYDENGFTFVTNYDSEKGKALLQNPKVCLSFFWPSIERQVIIKGMAEKQSSAYSEGYFHSRPTGSQLGAIVSPQSEVIPNRQFLEDSLQNLEQEWEGKEIPRPENWGGILVKPVSIEFWQGRPNRLHDRLRYTLLPSGDWKIERLAP